MQHILNEFTRMFFCHLKKRIETMFDAFVLIIYALKYLQYPMILLHLHWLFHNFLIPQNRETVTKKMTLAFWAVEHFVVIFHQICIKSWTTGSGRLACPKNFKTPFFSRYQKFLSWGNSNGSRTTPNFFSKFFFIKYVRKRS